MRRKGNFGRWVLGLAPLYPACLWSISRSWPPWICARNHADFCESLEGCSCRLLAIAPDKTGPPSSFHSCRPRREACCSQAVMMSPPHTFLGSTDLAFPVPTVHFIEDARAEGWSRPARQGRRRLGLDETEHGVRLGWVGRVVIVRSHHTAPASWCGLNSNLRPCVSTAQTMRASLLASPIASTLACSRRCAATSHAWKP